MKLALMLLSLTAGLAAIIQTFEWMNQAANVMNQITQ